MGFGLFGSAQAKGGDLGVGIGQDFTVSRRIQENVGRRASDLDTHPAQPFWLQLYPCSARSFFSLGPPLRERHLHQTKRRHASATYEAASTTSRPNPRCKAPNGPAASLRARKSNAARRRSCSSSTRNCCKAQARP
jgi:hypothetical protein